MHVRGGEEKHKPGARRAIPPFRAGSGPAVRVSRVPFVAVCNCCFSDLGAHAYAARGLMAFGPWREAGWQFAFAEVIALHHAVRVAAPLPGQTVPFDTRRVVAAAAPAQPVCPSLMRRLPIAPIVRSNTPSNQSPKPNA